MAVNEKGFCSDELATKQFVRAEIAEVRLEIDGLRTEMHGEFGKVRNEIHALTFAVDRGLHHMTKLTSGAIVLSGCLTTTITAFMR